MQRQYHVPPDLQAPKSLPYGQTMPPTAVPGGGVHVLLFGGSNAGQVRHVQTVVAPA